MKTTKRLLAMLLVLAMLLTNLPAAALAEELSAEIIEMDETIEEEAGMSINEIFEKYGEEHFRDLESALIDRISKKYGKGLDRGSTTCIYAWSYS